MQSQILRSFRLAGKAPSRVGINRTAVLQSRPYATKQNMSATQDADTANPQSNVSSTGPVSSSADSASVNKSRATDSKQGSPDTASTQNPVSNPGEANAALSEEPQPSQEQTGGHPSEPGGQKRAKVEEQGKRPLDPADK